ncbi:MAG: hypothetical protein KIT34_06230 [Cyanobacteria bacterium TGS_CYA1]|nr:hypothetical protein [Cyanobacteria bacterium TGS_CYA1]
MFVKINHFSRLALIVFLLNAMNSVSLSCLALESEKKGQFNSKYIGDLCRNREYLNAYQLCWEQVFERKNGVVDASTINALNQLSFIANLTESVKLAIEYSKVSREILETEAKDKIDKQDLLLKKGTAYCNHANSLWLISKYDEALSYFNQSIQILDEALKSSSDKEAVILQKSEALRYKGKLLTLLFDYDAGKTCFVNALDLSKSALKANPGSVDYKQMWIKILIGLGELETENGDFEEAGKYFSQALELIEEKAFYQEKVAKYLKVYVLQKQRYIYLFSKKRAEVNELLAQSVKVAEQLLKMDSKNPEAQMTFANAKLLSLASGQKSISREERNELLKYLECCITDYPESCAPFKFIFDVYRLTATSTRHDIKFIEKFTISSIPASKVEQEKHYETLPKGSPFPSPDVINSWRISQLPRTDRDYMFDCAETALKNARRLNPDNLMLLLDEYYLLRSRVIPFEMTQENYNKLLVKIDEILAKDNRLLKAHVAKMNLLNESFVFVEDQKKLTAEREKELAYLNKTAPKRVKVEKLDSPATK